MKRLRLSLFLGVLALCAPAADKDKTPAPAAPFKDETLAYNLTAANAVTLGHAQLTTKKTAHGWTFDFSLQASVPGYGLRDQYHAESTANLCAVEFSKDTLHGKRQSTEKTTFDYVKSVASRETSGGGKSTSPISGCARDALSFLFWARQELAQGRVPPAQTVMAGAAYQISMENGGAQPVMVGKKSEDAERMLISVKGPRSDFSFEIFFARDKTHTPLVVRCPFPVGTLSLELVR